MDDKLRIYYDAEFTGLHRNTSLISIGMRTEFGSYFYAEFTDYDQSQINDWLEEHVIGNLKLKDKSFYKMHSGGMNSGYCDCLLKDTSEVIRSNLITWLQMELSKSGKKQIQFYTDCYAYDWMVLVELITGGGHRTAMDMPSWIYYIPYDLSTLLQSRDIDPDITRENYAGETELSRIKGREPFIWWGDECKHNSLWDAAVAQVCFNRVWYEGFMNSHHELTLEEQKAAAGGINTVNFRGVQVQSEPKRADYLPGGPLDWRN